MFIQVTFKTIWLVGGASQKQSKKEDNKMNNTATIYVSFVVKCDSFKIDINDGMLTCYTKDVIYKKQSIPKYDHVFSNAQIMIFSEMAMITDLL